MRVDLGAVNHELRRSTHAPPRHQRVTWRHELPDEPVIRYSETGIDGGTGPGQRHYDYCAYWHASLINVGA